MIVSNNMAPAASISKHTTLCSYRKRFLKEGTIQILITNITHNYLSFPKLENDYGVLIVISIM